MINSTRIGVSVHVWGNDSKAWIDCLITQKLDSAFILLYQALPVCCAVESNPRGVLEYILSLNCLPGMHGFFR